jgi:hypothetical protein
VRRVLALAALALAAGAPAFGARAAAPPRCAASAELLPASAYVGQQVEYRLRILRRRDVTSLEWETPLSFPTFRTEWLPGVSGSDRAEQDGETYLVFLERRALFAAHPGRLRVPSASLRCASSEGSEIAVVPALTLPVSELPAEGRPPEFSGLLGPVTLRTLVSSERLVLGGSLRLSVVAEADTNLWSMPSPRPALAAVADLEVFERPPELARDAGRSLVLRRYFGFDLVPRKAGALQLPELRVPYFDPATGRYAEAVAALPLLRVAEARRAAPDPRPPAEAEAPHAPSSALPVLLAAAVAAALLAGVALRRRRRAAAPDAISEGLAAARAAAARGDADAAARAAEQALRAALAGGGVPSAAEAEAGATSAAREAALLLAQLERARFAPDAAPPALAAVEAAIARLREPRGRER